jgi:hypothetical protein
MRRDNLLERLAKLGIASAMAERLLKAERALQRWAELECGDSNEWASWHVERDEKTGKPYRVTIPHRGTTKDRRYPIRDMERAALRWVREIAEPLGLVWYHQTDPRGCSLYVGRPEMLSGPNISTCYTDLVPVCF